MNKKTVIAKVALFVFSFIVFAGLVSGNNEPAPPKEAVANYHDEIAKTYDYRFGENPFLPSLAKTESGGFLDPVSFPTADYCAKCHAAVHKEWRESAHGNAFRAPFYKKNVELLINTKGIEFSRHCEGCHNPIALFSGSLTKDSKVDRSFDEDGVTCMTCHSITKIQNTAGLGSYVMGTPHVMVNEDGTPVTRPVSDEEIMKRPDLHAKAVMRDIYRSNEFCAVCHKAALPKQLNEYKWLRAFSVYDEWQQSSWSKESPLPFYKKDKVYSCQECHMVKTEAPGDYGAKDGKAASHRWLGANTAIPVFYGYKDQLQKTEAFLKDDLLGIDLFALRKGLSSESRDDGLIAPLDRSTFALKPGEKVTLSVVIQNKKIGHSLVPEQRDFYESWVEFLVKDEADGTVFHSGYLKPDGLLEERAHSYTNRLISGGGQLLDLHQVWESRTRAYDNTILPGQSDLVRYQFTIPETARGALTVTVKVNYRRFRKGFTDWVHGKSVDYPYTEMATRSMTLNIGQNVGKAGAMDDKEMLRWNNYGIALLAQRQYTRAINAFQKVVAIKPDYADGHTNIAIANYMYQRYDAALRSLAQAFKLEPHNVRARFYQALIYRAQGKLTQAIEGFKTVLAAYPRLRQARTELGSTYYQLQKFDLARAEFEALQTIDPDDLSAHYNLMLIYRRLGLKKQAAEQAAYFVDRKDDPGAAANAHDFLKNHKEISSESVPWHVHSDDSDN